jgi:mRNA-degrading endonuclease HigB of HigAB toxin-antitoxin module
MVVISKSSIKIFGNRHKDSIDPLIKWYEITRKAD